MEISEEYDCSHENSRIIADMASTLMHRLSHPSVRDLKFCKWHNTSVTEAIVMYKDRYKKVATYRESF